MPVVNAPSHNAANHHKFVELNMMLNGVIGYLITNHENNEQIHPKLAGKHIIHLNIFPKCSLILKAQSLNLENT
jgi:hypothetical protein